MNIADGEYHPGQDCVEGKHQVQSSSMATNDTP